MPGDVSGSAGDVRSGRGVEGPAQVQTAPAPAPARPIAQIATAGVQILAEGGQVEIRLSPEELGRVQLGLTASENSIVLSIQAERPETA